jgi:ATP-dependent Clp protease ATP-binding subunit ClpB
VLQREVLNQLSKEILAGTIDKDSVVGIELDGDRQIRFINLDAVEIE